MIALLPLLNRISIVQECDATADYSNSTARLIKLIFAVLTCNGKNKLH
jgi:hypothetical protein